MSDFIVQDPNILGGKPIINGTRMSVEVILELVSSGLSISDILSEYPFLNKNQVESALQFATDSFKKEERFIFKRPHITDHEISR